MEQPILSTTKGSRFIVYPLTSWRVRAQSKFGMFQRFRITDSQCRILLIGVDTLLLLAAVFAAWRFVQPIPVEQAATPSLVQRLGMQIWFWAGILLGPWYLFGWLTDLYDVWSAHARGLTAIRIMVALPLSLLLTLLVAFLVGLPLPGTFLLFYLGVGIMLLFAWRFGYAALSKTSLFVRRAVILGTGANAKMIADLLNQKQGMHYEITGYISETSDEEANIDHDLPVWHVTTSLLDLARELHVDTIIAAIKDEINPALYTELIACQSSNINVLSVPAIYHKLCQKVPVEYISPSWLLEPIELSSSRMRRICKRTLDLAISLLALPWFLVVFPLIALAIKLDSPGPVLYRQVRSGLGGKPFWILKFRTMYVDAEKDGKPRWAAAGDPRITPVGRILRKLRLDELPQFINILRGEMSLIGPRPERPEFVAQLEKELPYYATRLLVPPGLTGWAQIKYTYGNSVEDALIKLQYDIYYVRHWSVWMDIYILFQTVSVVLRAKGT